MNRETEKMNPETSPEIENEERDRTNLQGDSEKKSVNSMQPDNMSDDRVAEEKNENDRSWEDKYVELNDSYLRLMAEYDNFRKRTIREKADLIKSGGATVLGNILPVIDDFERALGVLQTTEDLPSTIEGVKLIYDKFISYLSQQGVKPIEAIGQPFDTEQFEAIATIPAPEDDMKGKVIDCIQTGYMLYDKVLRHAKVVVGE